MTDHDNQFRYRIISSNKFPDGNNCPSACYILLDILPQTHLVVKYFSRVLNIWDLAPGVEASRIVKRKLKYDSVRT